MSTAACVVGTILFTVVGQLLLKWRMTVAGEFSTGLTSKLLFLLRLVGDIWILLGFLAAVVVAFCWMAALSKLELSYAYPFMSVSFVSVLILSSVLLGESVTIAKAIGISRIIAGVIVVGVRS